MKQFFFWKLIISAAYIHNTLHNFHCLIWILGNIYINNSCLIPKTLQNNGLVPFLFHTKSLHFEQYYSSYSSTKYNILNKLQKPYATTCVEFVYNVFLKRWETWQFPANSYRTSETIASIFQESGNFYRKMFA